MKTYILLVLILFSINSYANEFIEVIDEGQQMSWFSEYKSRVKYINKHMPFIDKKTADNYLKNIPNNDFFSARNGDIGFIVDDYSNVDGPIIIDIAGYLISIRKNGVKRSSKEKYDIFNRKLTENDVNQFGFKLGKTTFKDALNLLNKSNAKFNSNLAYRGYREIPIIKITNYKYLPTINNIKANVIYLNFIDDKLYDINVTWEVDTILEAKKFSSNVISFIDEALKIRYPDARKKHMNRVKGKSVEYSLWINPEFSIYKKVFFTKSSLLDYAYRISYVNNDLYKKSKHLKSKIDNLVEIKQTNKKKKEAQQL